jgi:DNA topoisomerase-3
VTFEFEQREGGKKYPPRKTAAKKTPFGKPAAKKLAVKTAKELIHHKFVRFIM